MSREGRIGRDSPMQAEGTPIGVPAADVSAVVCAYTLDRWDDLLASVASLRTQVPRPREVILVIDYNDALLQRAREEIPDVIVVANDGQKGLSAARNRGIAVASGAIVAFLDDDAAAEPGWLAALCAPFKDPAVVGTGGYATATWDNGRPTWFPEEFDWVVGCSYRGLPLRESDVRNPLGCSMSYRRSAFTAVGGFHPGIGRVGRRPLGCEETELSIRLGRGVPGSRIVYAPAARVRHRVRDERARWRYFLSRCYAEGRSKAAVADAAGSGPTLSSERGYVARTLPSGFIVALARFVRGDRQALARAAAIALGLSMTTIGYGAGRLSISLGRSDRLVIGAVERFPEPSPTPEGL